MKKLEDYVITIPDFPEPGIMFRDVTSIMLDPDGLQLAIDELDAFLDGVEYDKIVGLESRGFLFGMPIAYKHHKPFVPIRKKGKLPRATVEKSYALEYGTATIEVHKEDLKPGEKIVIVDDLLATGGTAKAAAELVEACGCEVVKIVLLMELKGLHGRDVLSNYDVDTIIQYEGN